MLKKLGIEGFKCFDKEILSFGNLTLLTGVNSAGKSSTIQALLLLAQQEECGKKSFKWKIRPSGTHSGY